MKPDPPNMDGKLILRGVHLELTEAMKSVITTKAERLLRHEPRIVRIRINVEPRHTTTVTRYAAKGHIEIGGPDMHVTAESEDGLQHVEFSGALDDGYSAASIKAAADKLQEIVGVGALRMTVGSLGFLTGQALLDWLRASNQAFDLSKVTQQA